MRPNLCATPTEDDIHAYLKAAGFLFVSPKLDGVRGLVDGQQMLSRSLKPIRNKFVQNAIAGIGGAFHQQQNLHGYDGELIVGDPTAKDCYRTTMSQVMSYDGEPDFTFYVFDRWDLNGQDFAHRFGRLESNGRVKVLEQIMVTSVDQLYLCEESYLAAGYEGLIIARPDTTYKFGRSTPKEGGKCKLKRFVDSEMRVTGVEELMRNMNESKENELGYGARSSHKENMVPGGTMGKLVGVDIHDGREVKLGTGFTAAERDEIWRHRERELGKVWKYKHFPVGVKDKARHPVALGRRDPLDLLS